MITNRTILLVDDEPQIRNVLRASLTAQGADVIESRTANRLSSFCGRRR
jgi:DNA-binding response OmpR family regulator